jgi:hypothetical protein
MPKTMRRAAKGRPRMSPKFKELSSKALLAFFGLLIGLALFEGYLRLTGRGGQRFWQENPHLGWFHVPNMEGVYQKPCFSTWVGFNSRGLRDVEHDLDKPDDVYRIVILGDSYVEALQVKLEESFPRVLETLLNEVNLGKRFETINLATTGFGSDQQYLSLKHYGLEYKPDLVILAFLTGNDVRNNYHVLERKDNNAPKPFFVLDQNAELHQVPFDLRGGPLPNWVRGILGHLRIYGWISETIRQSLVLHQLLWRLGVFRVPPPDVTDVAGGGKGTPRIPLDFNVYLEKYPPEWEEAWRITKALILKTKEKAERHGAGFLLVSLTDGVALADPERVQGEYPDFKGVRYNFDKPVALLTRFAEEAGINYLPLLPLYREYLKKHQKPFTSIHYSCDGHWTPLGHRLAAEAIFQRIVADRLYEGGS